MANTKDNSHSGISGSDMVTLQKFSNNEMEEVTTSETLIKVPSLIQRGTIYLIITGIVASLALLYFGKVSSVFSLKGSLVSEGGYFNSEVSANGTVASLFAKEGDILKEGDTLLTLSPPAGLDDNGLVTVMPFDGKVIKLNVRFKGQSVIKSSILAVIEPVNSPMVIYATVDNREVGSIKPGQQVKIELDAYPGQQYGSLKGVVEQILQDVNNVGEFTVKIVPEKKSLVKDGAVIELISGLACKIEIITGEQRLINMLFSGKN